EMYEPDNDRGKYHEGKWKNGQQPPPREPRGHQLGHSPGKSEVRHRVEHGQEIVQKAIHARSPRALRPAKTCARSAWLVISTVDRVIGDCGPSSASMR